MSDDEYPTEEDLERITTWDFVATPGFVPFMDYVKARWWSPDWGWSERDGVDELFDRPVHIYEISTGGWSGNESLIGAMQENFVFWSLNWMQSRRGGHYTFYVSELEKS